LTYACCTPNSKTFRKKLRFIIWSARGGEGGFRCPTIATHGKIRAFNYGASPENSKAIIWWESLFVLFPTAPGDLSGCKSRWGERTKRQVKVDVWYSRSVIAGFQEYVGQKKPKKLILSSNLRVADGSNGGYYVPLKVELLKHPEYFAAGYYSSLFWLSIRIVSDAQIFQKSKCGRFVVWFPFQKMMGLTKPDGGGRLYHFSWPFDERQERKNVPFYYFTISFVNWYYRGFYWGDWITIQLGHLVLDFCSFLRTKARGPGNLGGSFVKIKMQSGQLKLISWNGAFAGFQKKRKKK